MWIRDEWSVTESAVKKSAAEAGDESPIVFVFLPKREVDQIKDTLASFAAAEDTLRRPTPQTDEGKAAQRAMKTRVATDDERLDEPVPGGRRPGAGLPGRRRARSRRRRCATPSRPPPAARSSGCSRSSAPATTPTGARSSPRPATAPPTPSTPSATTASRPPTPCARRCSPRSAPAGTKGADLQKRFAAPPYGWPKDAVNGAMLTLLAAGNIRAAQDGKDLGGPKELPPTQIGKVTLYKEDEPPSVSQRLAVKGLLDRRRHRLRGRAGGRPDLRRCSSG